MWFEQNIKATQITPQLGNANQFDHVLDITSLMYVSTLVLYNVNEFPFHVFITKTGPCILILISALPFMVAECYNS